MGGSPEKMLTMNSVEFLQKWFGSQCNGDWEHCFGLKIATLDNPGWHVSVELEETPLAGVAFSPVLEERTEEDWVCCRIKDGCFEGFGGVGNLMEILDVFQRFVENSSANAKT